MSSSYNIVGSANGHRSTEYRLVRTSTSGRSDSVPQRVLGGRQTPRILPTDINDFGGC